MPAKKDAEEIARLRKELVDVMQQVGELDPALQIGELKILQKHYQDIRSQILKLQAKSEG